MLLSDIRTEFLARGEDFLDSAGTTRQDMFINTSYQRIAEAFDWPWLYADATGATPLTISDLRTVLSVVDSTNNVKLVHMDRRELIEADPALTASGSPYYWYRDSDVQIKVYPTTSVTLAVRYIKVPAALSGPTDTPLIPTRWQSLIVDGAMVEAFKDSEDYNELQSLEQVFEQRLAQMKAAYREESGPSWYVDPVVSGWTTTF